MKRAEVNGTLPLHQNQQKTIFKSWHLRPKKIQVHLRISDVSIMTPVAENCQFINLIKMLSTT